MDTATTTTPYDMTLDHPDPCGHPALDGAPVSRITGPLREALIGLAARLDPLAAAADPDGSVCDALRLIVGAAYDTAEPGERPGLLYVTPAVAELGRRPVWLERDRPGGPITARFPADR
ncbi:hypothetical protein ACWEQL_17510 [Kitasatospora sp. NPDC004240]